MQTPGFPIEGDAACCSSLEPLDTPLPNALAAMGDSTGPSRGIPVTCMFSLG